MGQYDIYKFSEGNAFKYIVPSPTCLFAHLLHLLGCYLHSGCQSSLGNSARHVTHSQFLQWSENMFMHPKFCSCDVSDEVNDMFNSLL